MTSFRGVKSGMRTMSWSGKLGPFVIIDTIEADQSPPLCRDGDKHRWSAQQTFSSTGGIRDGSCK